MSQFKRCAVCGEEKSVSEFFRKRGVKSWLSKTCNSCSLEKSRAYREGNREKLRDMQRARYNADAGKAKRSAKLWRLKNPDKVKGRKLKERFGISLEDYNIMLEAQGGVCAANGCHSTDKMLTVDHCHETNKIRGLLCNKCNLSIGCIDDSIEKLKGLIVYLERSNR